MNNEEEKTLEEVAQTQNKLYKIRDKEKAKSYPEISAQQKHDTIADIVKGHREAFIRNANRKRVDLRDPAAVEIEINDYLSFCELRGQIPTLLGLSVFMGYSRRNLYSFMANHWDEESAQLLDNFRASSAAIIAQASLNRVCDNATSIFLLKNAGQYLSDRQEIELSRGEDLIHTESADTIAMRWEKAFNDGIELPD